MTKPAAPAHRTDSRDLAIRIYVDLAGRNITFTPEGVKMTASADNMARMSFKLAEAFLACEDALDAVNRPTDQNYKVDVADIAAWSKPGS